MIARFLDAGHSAPWVAGYEVYGGNPKLRTVLEERGTGYVLAVARTHEVTTHAGKFRADVLAKRLPKRAWQKLSAGTGAKGQRFYDWAEIALLNPRAGHHHLLIRRNRTTGELAYYRCYSPQPVPLGHPAHARPCVPGRGPRRRTQPPSRPGHVDPAHLQRDRPPVHRLRRRAHPRHGPPARMVLLASPPPSPIPSQPPLPSGRPLCLSALDHVSMKSRGATRVTATSV